MDKREQQARNAWKLCGARKDKEFGAVCFAYAKNQRTLMIRSALLIPEGRALALIQRLKSDGAIRSIVKVLEQSVEIKRDIARASATVCNDWSNDIEEGRQ